MYGRQFDAAMKTAVGNRSNVKVIRKTADGDESYYIKPYENVVVVYNTASGSGNHTLYLPKSGECPAGHRIFMVYPTANNTNAIKDQSDSAYSGWSDLQPDADNDYAIVENTAKGWVTAVNGIST